MNNSLSRPGSREIERSSDARTALATDSDFHREVLRLQTPDFYFRSMIDMVQAVESGLPFSRSKVHYVKENYVPWLGLAADRRSAILKHNEQGQFANMLFFGDRESSRLALLGIVSADLHYYGGKNLRKMPIFTYDPGPWQDIQRYFGHGSRDFYIVDLNDTSKSEKFYEALLARILSKGQPKDGDIVVSKDEEEIMIVVDELDTLVRRMPKIGEILANWNQDNHGSGSLLASASQKFSAMLNPIIHKAELVAEPLIFGLELSEDGGTTFRYMPFRVYPPIDILHNNYLSG